MRRARGPLWWYELRYTLGWQVPALVGLASVLLIIAAVAGLPQWIVQKQNAMGFACLADGGRIVFERSSRGGTTIPVCHRD